MTARSRPSARCSATTTAFVDCPSRAAISFASRRRSKRDRRPNDQPSLSGNACRPDRDPVSVIDGLATLVRGHKLPIFSVGGLPHLELAAQIAAQATAGDEPLAVVFAVMGVTNADAAAMRERLGTKATADDLVVFPNTADDPPVERIVTPRLALTFAEAPRVRPRPSRARRFGGGVRPLLLPSGGGQARRLAREIREIAEPPSSSVFSFRGTGQPVPVVQSDPTIRMRQCRH